MTTVTSLPPVEVPAVLRSALQQAEAAVEARNLRSAEALYRQLLLLAPDDVEVLRGMARLWVKAGRGERAVPYAVRAAEVRPDDPRILQLLGESLS